MAATHRSITKKLSNARADAINAYAGLELELCRLFGLLTKIESDTAHLIFFRIVNYRARNAIVGDIIKKEFGKTYQVYWRSMFKMIGRLDQKRNAIVHWHIGGSLKDERIIPALRSPLESFPSLESPGLRYEEIAEFTEQARFVAVSIFFFGLMAWGAIEKWSPDGQQTLRETFLRPLTYPLPDTHPISRILKGRGNRPRSSRK